MYSYKEIFLKFIQNKEVQFAVMMKKMTSEFPASPLWVSYNLYFIFNSIIWYSGSCI